VKENLSGRFVIRLPPRLHAILKRRARNDGVSLNGLCLEALQTFTGAGVHGGQEDKSVDLEAVRGMFGPALTGVILFGSTARGESRESSDIDLLIVLEEKLTLARSLYERWDRTFTGTAGSSVSPHFVHLPRDEEKAGSLWCEAALDGVVLLDPEGAVVRLLRRIRRSMAEGSLQRKSAYGHPYWIRRGREVARVQ
jgi:predicted nucleotidyltransferase